ncbi:hypothetical protein LRS13_21465 [Svornostia abyssi]|uniref:Uncharacterized protein n=1 Tax=Svornostia abyssi TaxID=2898438 RepID=A0ABY5PF62_9ACTN|nr:hypothetical protein LRS13_21465 [Parviterribacteraceae bacterium J379]
MKKRIAPAVALAAALAVPAAAQAEVIQDFTISASPSKASTAKVKRSVTLKVKTGTRDTTGALPPTTKKATLFFPKGSQWNGDLFPKCSGSSISAAKSTDDCPEGSIIGKGKAAGAAPGGISQNDLTIVVANGGKSTVNMFVEGTSPLRIQSNIEAKIAKITGKYGIRLEVPIPQNLQEPAPGVPVAITNFEVSVGKSATIKKQKRGIIEITRCDGGQWSGEGTFEYVNSPNYSASRTIKCSKG